MEYLLIMDRRALALRICQACFCSDVALKSASLKALLSFDGTTQPVSPTIILASPTSVETQGTPVAIASPMTFGKPSSLELRQR